MRKIYYILFLVLIFLFSCKNKVEIGSWYENIKSKERIKILDIGLPKDILSRHHQRLKSEFGDSLISITFLDYDSTKYSNVVCFVYNKSEKGYWLAIKPIETLDQDFLKIK